MIEVSELSFSYSTGTTITFPNFKIGNGEHCILLGESGSGKTTLLHLLGGLLRGYTGSVKINNLELKEMSEGQLDTFRGKNLGFVFQKNHLISALNVEKNLALSPYLVGMDVDTKRVNEVLHEMGMADKVKSKINELSFGQAQRVAIARAILNKPTVILADEPTSALDDTNCEKVINLLLRAAEVNNATLVIATHDHRLKLKIAKQVNIN